MASKDMSDFDIERLCHEALGYFLDSSSWPTWMLPWHPLTNDGQAMALVKKFRLSVKDVNDGAWHIGSWRTGSKGQAIWESTSDSDLNRAICECVAKMQLSRAGKNEEVAG